MNYTTDTARSDEQSDSEQLPPGSGLIGQTWSGHTWNIIAASSELQDVLFNGKPAQFRLEQRLTNGTTAYAVRPVNSTGLPACFEPDTLLTPAGTELPGPHQGDKLPVSSDADTDTHSLYWDASDKVTTDARMPKFMRLEGMGRLCGENHHISLYQVEDALENGKSLLVLKLLGADRSKNPDGIAVGNN